MKITTSQDTVVAVVGLGYVGLPGRNYSQLWCKALVLMTRNKSGASSLDEDGRTSWELEDVDE